MEHELMERETKAQILRSCLNLIDLMKPQLLELQEVGNRLEAQQKREQRIRGKGYASPELQSRFAEHNKRCNNATATVAEISKIFDITNGK